MSAKDEATIPFSPLGLLVDSVIDDETKDKAIENLAALGEYRLLDLGELVVAALSQNERRRFLAVQAILYHGECSTEIDLAGLLATIVKPLRFAERRWRAGNSASDAIRNGLDAFPVQKTIEGLCVAVWETLHEYREEQSATSPN